MRRTCAPGVGAGGYESFTYQRDPESSLRPPLSRYPRVLGGLLLPGVFLLHGCTSARMVRTDRGPQAYYQTAYPGEDTSRELERAFESVRRVSYTAEYATYLFAEAAGVTEAEVRAGRFESRADTAYTETRSKSGTATIIARSGNQLTLMTTHHVVHFPPLRIEFWDEALRGAGTPDSTRRVAAVSVRRSEVGILIPHPGESPFEVLARDEPNDIALLGLVLGERSDPSRFRPLELGNGDPRRLSWGSFTLVLGYPLGYPMVTRGIVSNPDFDGRGSFVTDGLWNEGISGGLILAVRGETGALEIVGLARAGAAERDLRLQPDTADLRTELGSQRYGGDLYVESVLRIQYGITLPVSMTRVSEFMDRHRAALRSRGYL